MFISNLLNTFFKTPIIKIRKELEVIFLNLDKSTAPFYDAIMKENKSKDSFGASAELETKSGKIQYYRLDTLTRDF